MNQLADFLLAHLEACVYVFLALAFVPWVITATRWAIARRRP